MNVSEENNASILTVLWSPATERKYYLHFQATQITNILEEHAVTIFGTEQC
jgi:hypothetical protein